MPEAKKIITARNGILYELDLTEHIDSTIYQHGCFEPATAKAIAWLCKPGMTALDIGANIGAHTFHLAKLTGPTGEVIAFEPTSYAFSKLAKNLALNLFMLQQFKHVTVEKIALSNENRRAEAHFDSSWPISGNVAPSGNAGEPMAFMTLDAYLSTKGIGRVDFIKLDVDGYEHKILQGAVETLKRSGPRMVIELCDYRLKMTGDRLDAMIATLAGLGYHFYSETTFAEFHNTEHILRSVPENSSLNVVLSQTHPAV